MDAEMQPPTRVLHYVAQIRLLRYLCRIECTYWYHSRLWAEVRKGGDMSDPEKSLRIAGMESRTAIIVAVVGALSTFGAVFVTKYLDSGKMTKAEWQAQAPKQDWLRIKDIEGPRGLSFRLMAHVDNVTYSYPTHTTWARIGPHLTEGKFPLPLSTGNHNIRFAVESPRGAITEYTSQESHSRGASNDQHIYKLVPLSRSSTGSTRGAISSGDGSTKDNETDPIRVIYAITED